MNAPAMDYLVGVAVSGTAPDGTPFRGRISQAWWERGGTGIRLMVRVATKDRDVVTDSCYERYDAEGPG